MWRALVFLGLLCLAAFGAVWLANHPETVAVTWAGREYSTSLAVGVVGLVAVALVVAAVLGAIRFAVGLPGHLARRARQNRDRKGHRAISRGIVAIAAGDLAAGRRYAAEAERLVGHEPLALLLKAQSAQAAGDRGVAEAAFREMTERPETRALGLRGLYLETRRRGDLEAAHDHAAEAARLAPALGWANDAVLEARSAEGDWRGAIATVERRTSLGLVDRATSRRLRAVLLTADATSREASDPDGALAAAQDAVKLAPDLVPAAALAARLLSRRGELKRAARIVEAAWTAGPHPELAAAYLNLRPGDSAIDRLRRAETLARLSSWSDEARLAIARTAIDARELARAREVLRPLVDGPERPTVRLCMMMAELENRSGHSGAVREWLARAARAPRDKAWIADGHVSDRWAPVSPVTGRLDAFRWETPPEAIGGSADHDPEAFRPEPERENDDETPLIPSFLSPAAGRAAAPGAGDDEKTAIETEHEIAAAVAPPAERPVPSPARDGNAPDGEAGLPARPVPEPATSGPDAAPSAPLPTTRAESATAQTLSGPGANGTGRRGRDPAEPVVFPVSHAPDDPGLEGEGDRRQRFRLRV